MIKLKQKSVDMFYLRLQGGFVMIPHFEKKDKGGEDSFLFDDNIIMVADGVGSWNQYGVDPGLYSKELRDKYELLTSALNVNMNQSKTMELKKSMAKKA